jgi:AAA domain (dynein-related subfamily)
VRAMREGRALLLDDATLIPPSVLAVVYPAMDGRREIVVKANGGEIVTAQPGFYVIAGHNLLLTEPTAVFSQFSDLLAVVSLSGPWTMRGTHRERWRVWSAIPRKCGDFQLVDLGLDARFCGPGSAAVRGCRPQPGAGLAGGHPQGLALTPARTVPRWVAGSGGHAACSGGSFGVVWLRS